MTVASGTHYQFDTWPRAASAGPTPVKDPCLGGRTCRTLKLLQAGVDARQLAADCTTVRPSARSHLIVPAQVAVGPVAFLA